MFSIYYVCHVLRLSTHDNVVDSYMVHTNP